MRRRNLKNTRGPFVQLNLLQLVQMVAMKYLPILHLSAVQIFWSSVITAPTDSSPLFSIHSCVLFPKNPSLKNIFIN